MMAIVFSILGLCFALAVCFKILLLRASQTSCPSKYSPGHCEDEALLGAGTCTGPGLCAGWNSGETGVTGAWTAPKAEHRFDCQRHYTVENFLE